MSRATNEDLSDAGSVSAADLGWSVPRVSHLSLLRSMPRLMISLHVVLVHPVPPFSLNLIGCATVQILQGLVTDLVHSEGTIASVVAWSLWPFEVARTHVAATSGRRSRPASDTASAWRIPWLIPGWSWLISWVHWWRTSIVVLRALKVV